MNASSNSFQTQLDRLIDGELSASEYRSLIASLEDQPEGWRRCALAFLEAQALGHDLSAARSLAAASLRVTNRSEEVGLPAQQPDDWSHRAWQGLYFATIAASLAVAFYVGSWTSGLNSGLNNASTGSSLAKSQPGPGSQPEDRTSSTSIASESSPSEAVARNEVPLRNVQLVVDGPEASQRVNVPVYDENQFDRWDSTNKPALPPQVIEQLRKAGHDVAHDQQWILIDTDDGEQVLVPVDNYRIQPPKRPAY